MGGGRAPCCDKSKVKQGPWSPAEDLSLTTFIQNHGHSNWRALPKQAGLLRCGKSCRLRWINYLRPDVKRGNFTPEEEQTIINLHNSIGNKWSKIASYLPGRTDNEIKNVWNTHLKKRLPKKSAGDKTDSSKAIYSASPTSSSITSSEVIKNPNDENPDSLKVIKSSDHSDSSTSSYKPDFSNSGQPNEASEFPTVIDTEGGSETNGKIEIALDSDIDIWELFDSLETKTGENNRNQDSKLSKPDSEIERSEWFRLLETELGLTSSDVDNDDMTNDEIIVVPTTTQQPEVNLEPQNIISLGLDFYPIWPSSPLI